MSGPDFFGFKPTEELPGGFCSRVWADATRVVKVPFQGEELTTGRIAAERMSPWPGVRVLDSDADSGAILMERLGQSLADQWSPEDDDASTDVFLALAPAIRDLSTDGLMPLRDYVPKTDPLAQELLASSPDEVFLHGDLHHHNILRHHDGWRIIDPKGLFGDPAWEAAAFILNPIGIEEIANDLVPLFRHRIQRIAAGLGVSSHRVWAWSLVLSLDSDSEAWTQATEALEKIHDWRSP